MLKIAGSPKKPASKKNDSSRLASSRNNGSRPASKKNNGDGEVDGFDVDGVEQVRKSKKLKKLAKSQKSSKSGKPKGKKSKKQLKIGNLRNFDAKNSGPSVLTPKARSALNCLRLAFTKVFIFWDFDPKCYIWIETDVLGYVIVSVLSQLVSQTTPDRIVTKADLG